MAASRFKNQSKYKNVFGQAPKREFWLQDILAPNEFNFLGRAIAASCSHLSFCWETNGTIALYPLGRAGRLQAPYSLLHAHAAAVSDMEFSPFHSGILATGGEDKQVKIWRLDGELAKAECTIDSSYRVEAVTFNPFADSIIASCNGKQLIISDISSQQSVYSQDISGDTVQSISWGLEGGILGAVGKDRVIRCVDPRAIEGSVVDVGTFSVGKEFQIQCLPAEKLAISSLNQSKDRELSIWDIRACKKLNSLTFGNSNRTMSLLFDADTNMLFLSQRGEVFIHYLEVGESSPYLTMGASYLGNTETKSLCLIPKRAVDVMKCEIDRILQLTKRDIVPISFSVTRKSYIDFHADLYPDTFGNEPGMTSQEWVNGLNRAPKLTTLDPEKIARAKAKLESQQNKSEAINEPIPEPEEELPIKSIKVIPGLRSTPFKHLEGKLAHKSTFIFDLPPLCKTIPLDGHMLQVSLHPSSLLLAASKDPLCGIAAVTLHGAGGQIALVPISSSGRLIKVVTLENTSPVIDMVWDKFDCTRLVVASEDSRIRVWNITPESLESGVFTHSILDKHRDRPSTLAFHPFASSVLVSSGSDCQLLIWDLNSFEVKLSLSAPYPIVCLAWSTDGSQLATFDRNSNIYLYSPTQGVDAIWEGIGPSSGRAGRVIWMSKIRILLSGFEKMGTKVFYLFDTSKTGLESILSVVSIINVSSPSLLIPYFDSDTNLVIFTARGESTVFVYEYLSTDHPFFFSLSPLFLTSQNQELSFFPKLVCQIRDCEVVRGIRLTQSSLEGFGFKVPRVRTEFFQNDLFPETEVTWLPVLTADEYLSGKKPEIAKISLQPEGMIPLSKAPVKSSGHKSAKSTFEEFKSSSDHEKELVDGMISRMKVMETKPLKQDLMEGVDDDEWGD